MEPYVGYTSLTITFKNYFCIYHEKNLAWDIKRFQMQQKKINTSYIARLKHTFFL